MLEWRDNNLPVSIRFDDPYYSRQDGRAETDHVFLKSNNLPERWPQMRRCTIAELGFGTGLNFLETVRQWGEFRPDGATLHFISFEQYPLPKDDMATALSVWSQLTDLAQILLNQWTPEASIFECQLSEMAKLTVHMGDANELLPKLNFEADAWFLDGFSPAKNPELWNETLMNEVGKHTVSGGTFATYTAAGFVRRNLENAGFSVTKTNGFAHKRDMLIGKKA